MTAALKGGHKTEHADINRGVTVNWANKDNEGRGGGRERVTRKSDDEQGQRQKGGWGLWEQKAIRKWKRRGF